MDIFPPVERGWNSQKEVKPYKVGKRGRGKGLAQENTEDQ
jgi:hypothetical protein